MPIYKPSELMKLGIRAKKSLSQNFLIDRNILEKMIHVAEIHPGDLVIEIGPGPGALTELLLEKGAHIIAIEKDKYLAKELERLQTKDQRLKIFAADARTFPLEKILKEKAKVVANLPYHITSSLLQKFVPLHTFFSSLTVMVQREFGRRMTAQKNSSMYSSFTLYLQAYSHLKYCFTVKPTCFFPSPSVHSCVIHLDLHPLPFSFPPEPFFAFVRSAFGKRRKMLSTSLKEQYSREAIQQALQQIGLNPTARPQELSLENFCSLFHRLAHTKNHPTPCG